MNWRKVIWHGKVIYRSEIIILADTLKLQFNLIKYDIGNDWEVTCKNVADNSMYWDSDLDWVAGLPAAKLKAEAFLTKVKNNLEFYIKDSLE